MIPTLYLVVCKPYIIWVFSAVDKRYGNSNSGNKMGGIDDFDHIRMIYNIVVVLVLDEWFSVSSL